MMTAIDTDNLVNDFVVNLAKIFEGHTKSLGIKEIYKDDLYLITSVPSIAISCNGLSVRLRTVGSRNVRYTFNFSGVIWYYHSAINPDVTTNMVMRSAYKIAEHIIKKASLNGFLVNERADVRSCVFSNRIRAGNLLSSARITVLAPYLKTIQEIS